MIAPPKIRLSALVLVATLLAGCAGTSEQPAPETPAPVAAPSASAAPRISGTIKASRADELMGQSPKGLRALLGAPTLLRQDHGAQMWQYAGKSCVLLAYLYPNAKGEPEVSYLDARAKSAGSVPVADCLAQLARDGHAPTS
jgi:hypothetical protein